MKEVTVIAIMEVLVEITVLIIAYKRNNMSSKENLNLSKKMIQ